MPSSSALADDFVRTSAFLMREYIGRNLAAAWKGSGGKAIYVFDTDVILTRCAPWITGPLGKGRARHGLGHLFARPTSDVEAQERQRKDAASMASILSRYALGLPRGNGEASDRNLLPIFQLPSHFIETNNLFRTVRRKVEAIEPIDRRRSKTRRNLELARVLALARHSIESGEESQAALETSLNRVIELLANRSEHGGKQAQLLDAWDAYFELETQYGGLYSLADASYFFDDDRELTQALEALEPSKRTEDEHGLHDTFVHYWTGRHTGLSQDLNVKTDAEALADLFLVNLRLCDTPYRCILVTGHRNLVESVFEAPLERICHAEVRDRASFLRSEVLAERFSLEHVRHLWAYSIEALIEREERSGFVNMFGGLLANWSKPLEIPVPVLEHLAKHSKPGKSIPRSRIEKLLICWEELTRKAIGRSAIKRQDAMVRATIRAAFIEKISEKGWYDFIEILEEEIDRVLDRTVLAMSDLGVDQVIKAHKLGRRNPPELVFDSLKHTNALIERFARAGAQMTTDEFEDGFADIERDCHEPRSDDDRQLSYLKFVVLGAAFASADKWMIAHDHARRAIAIVERSQALRSPIPVKAAASQGAPKTHMSGREALFLAAVSQRILSRSARDLGKSAMLLRRAQEALDLDHMLGTAKNISHARFINERLATCLSRYYLLRSGDETRFHDDAVREAFAAAKRVLEFFDRFTSDNVNPLERVTIVSAATNVIQVHVIAEFRAGSGQFGPKGPTEPRDIAAALGVLRLNTDWKQAGNGGDGPRISSTPLIRVYGLVGEMLLEGKSAFRDAYPQLSKLLANPKEISVTTYDDWRFKALLQFVGRLVAGLPSAKGGSVPG